MEVPDIPEDMPSGIQRLNFNLVMIFEWIVNLYQFQYE